MVNRKVDPEWKRKTPYVGELLELLKEQNPTGVLLDLGCGPGEVLFLIKEQFPSLVLNGLDQDPLEIEQAKTLLGDKAIIHKGVGEAMPYEINTFDVIYCGHVLEHVKYPELILHEIMRVIKPEGLIIIQVPYKFNMDCSGHIHHWDIEQFRRLIDKQLEVIDIWRTKEDTGNMTVLCRRKPYNSERRSDDNPNLKKLDMPNM